MIEAYGEGYGFQAFIFRFVSILGERYSHGHVFDFFRSLQHDPAELRVLGNGRQRKSYMYIQDCLDAMFLAIAHAGELVLDPFGGTCTTAVAAEKLGRRWLVSEIDPRYTAVLPERIAKGR